MKIYVRGRRNRHISPGWSSRSTRFTSRRTCLSGQTDHDAW